MGRLVKIILVILLLLVIAIVALPFFIDPNDYKPEIQTAVKEQTGRELTIEGDLELSVFPWLGVSTGNLMLSNAAGFSEKPFVKIEASQVKVKLLPLLSKKLEVSRIELKGLDLYLAKNKQGISNWDDLITPKEEEEQSVTEEENNNNVNPLAALALGGISIEQAHIIWDDQQQGKYSELNDFNLKTGKLDFDQPIDVELSFNLTNKNPDLTESLDVSTVLTINEQLDIIQLKWVDLNSLTTGKIIPGEKLTAMLQSDILVNLTEQTIAISGLKLNLEDVTEQKLTVNLQSDMAINLTNQAVKTSRLQIDVANLMQNKLNVNLITGLDLNLSKQTLLLSDLKLNAGELNLSATINASQIKDKPTFSGPINIAPFNLAQFMKTLDIALPEMKDTQALSLLSAAFDLQATTDSANINKLAIKLDDTSINGSIAVKNFNKPSVNFDINLDAIDVSRYLSPEKENKPKVVTPAIAAVSAAQLFPVETLRELNANGKLSIGTLILDQIKLKGLSFKLNANKGVVKTQQEIKQLYQGSYSGHSSINVQGSTPRLLLNEKLSNIQVEPLFKAMDITDRMSGLVNATVIIQGQGNSTEAIKSSLNGHVNFNFSDSIIKGFNIQKLIDGTRLLIEGKALPAQNKNDQSIFSVIKGSAAIKNGLLMNDDLLAESSKVRVVGKGTANLATEALNYSIDARLLKSLEKEEGFKGIPLAVKIGGTFSEPSYLPDVETMLKAKYSGKINKEKEKLFKKLDEKLGPGVSDVLKGFGF